NRRKDPGVGGQGLFRAPAGALRGGQTDRCKGLAKGISTAMSYLQRAQVRLERVRTTAHEQVKVTEIGENIGFADRVADLTIESEGSLLKCQCFFRVPRRFMGDSQEQQ